MYKNAKNRKLIWCYLAVVKRGAKVIDLEKHFTISGTIAKNFIHFTWLTSNSLYILTSSENRRKSTNNKYFVEILRFWRMRKWCKLDFCQAENYDSERNNWCVHRIIFFCCLVPLVDWLIHRAVKKKEVRIMEINHTHKRKKCLRDFNVCSFDHRKCY